MTQPQCAGKLAHPDPTTAGYLTYLSGILILPAESVLEAVR